MRFFLSFLFVLTVASTFILAVGEAVQSRASWDQSASERTGLTFVWPDVLLGADSPTALKMLTEAADATGSNVIRTSARVDQSGRLEITHYIYMSQESTHLFDQIGLSDGRWPTRDESRGSVAYVSTQVSETGVLVGRPNVLANGYDLTVAPLVVAFDHLPTAGKYVVESADAAEAAAFVDRISRDFQELGMSDPGIVLTNDEPSVASAGGFGVFILSGVLTLFGALIVLFVTLRSGKAIGVMRMVGLSTVRVWFRLIGRLQLVSALLAVIGCAVAILTIPGADALFALKVLGVVIAVAGVSIAATGAAGIGVITRYRVSDLVKGTL